MAEKLKLLFDGPGKATVTVVLAHGAGAPMDSPFMNHVASGLGERGLRVARFEFPYMAARRNGGRKPPDREPRLREVWLEVVESLGGGEHVIIGGKSMGGRMASLVADEAAARGLLCFGFPFHAPGKSPGSRIAHLESLRTPALIIQGTRDAFGTPDDVAEYPLSPSIRIAWIEDGDHSLKPRAKSGRTEKQNLEEAIELAANFASGVV